MRSYGMHAYSGVADQRKTLCAELRCMNADQRICISLADELHVTVSTVESMLNIGAELCVVHFHY